MKWRGLLHWQDLIDQTSMAVMHVQWPQTTHHQSQGETATGSKETASDHIKCFVINGFVIAWTATTRVANARKPQTLQGERAQPEVQ